MNIPKNSVQQIKTADRDPFHTIDTAVARTALDASYRDEVKFFLLCFAEFQTQERKREEQWQQEIALLRNEHEANGRKILETHSRDNRREERRHNERLETLKRQRRRKISEANRESAKLNREAQLIRDTSFMEMKRAHRVLRKVGLGHLISIAGYNPNGGKNAKRDVKAKQSDSSGSNAD
jgi:hypothetical protein